MALKKMSKQEVPMTLGAFDPVGHVVIAFESDEHAERAAQALLDDGFYEDDIVRFTASEEASTMTDMLTRTSGIAEFGFEAVLMRRYRQLAAEGCGWLVVFAPETVRAERVADIARQHGARIAERYRRLVIEDLI